MKAFALGLEVYLNLDEADRDQSAVGGGHHLHSIAAGVCLSGGDSRRFFATLAPRSLGTMIVLCS